ncbi:MAG: hypothetical protein IIT97_03725, partial [Mycoplasmataceae bacterium]|nr:hypothetical protein [Mycoplasmataceae bacterium]
NVQSYSSLVSGSPTLLNSFNFNNNLNYTATNFSYSNFGPAGQACTYNNAPLEVSGNMNFNGINSNGNLEFNLTGVELPMPCVYSGKSWPYNQFQDPSVTYSTNGNWILTLPFNMNTIYNNIQNAISNISLSYYEFKQQWKIGLVNQINQKINGCIPSYMSSCFVSSSTVTTYGATGGQINTTVTYIDGEGKSIPWHFTTTVTMPAQPSDESAYKLFKKEFSQPITLFSNTSNVWDSNKYWNSSTVPVDISSKPKTSSYIKTNNNIYYNGNLSTNNSTWCTNKAVLANYINMIFNLVENEIESKANTANPDPFSNNPISLSYSFITTQNETHEIQTKLTFNNNNFNNVSNINSNYKNSPWIFDTAVSLSLTTFYYSGSILNRINIQALPMPVAGSFQLEPDNGYLIKGSNQTTTSGSNNGSGFINAGTYLYYSSALLTFTGNMSEEDILEINNQPISVINNQFTYNLTAPSVFDNTTNNTNSSSSNTNNSSISKTYNIEIYKNSIPIFEETVIITRGVPNVNFKWYAWNPSQKPWQEKLITQNLSNGKANPQYNPLINPNTGSINQILWVNGPTPNNESYFADPLQSNNQPYNFKNSVSPNDQGYIADAQVFNKGVSVDWNINNANVHREGLEDDNGELVPSNNPTNNPAFNGLGQWEQIQPNNSDNESYFSYSGLWEYVTQALYNGNNWLPSNSGIYSYYLIDVINSNNEQQISKFTNVVKTSNVIPFWTSIHGIHLMYYLKNNENMTTSQIQKLTYPQVQYWWNNYCSSTINETANSNELFNLANCSLKNISLNNNNITQIQNIIDKDIENALAVYNLLNTVDYTINISSTQLQDLANYQSDKNGTYSTTISVSAVKDNLACYGTLNITVTDSINNLCLNNILLGQVDVGVIGNSKADILELENDIINQIQLEINNYCLANNIKTEFNYGTDWTINWNNINNLVLINNKQVALNFIYINAISNTDCYGQTETLVVNNINFTNPNNFFDLGYLSIPNLMMNLTNTNLNFLTIEISNYIFLDINQAFNNYFSKHKLNPTIENELNYSWTSNNYSAKQLMYPNTFNKYWTINNYTNLVNELVNNITNKSFNNEVTFFITPTTNGSMNLYGAIPFLVDNSSLNRLGVTNSNKYYYPNIYNPKDNSGDQYNPYATNSSNKKSNDNNKTHSSLPEWAIPVIAISILIIALIITAIYQRIKHRNYI